ncbi:uncharacterized protein B0I36DRAFT_276695 [Microdochium trichocladiopsis]|uniref:Rhodopsin domain-containing protein n=1 Tax=Microdochium trichocladiopsis TaxID=1682393 RepID=A0A9P8XU87_9PEZI|nr:uncharacterized protein B0I36DRAFT_276695 [Microdochium trichocladiopsis]KAH7018203.1 hypothetical protein B0I36DRAFT_276695 [Microdochium trichocladiopsis]
MAVGGRGNEVQGNGIAMLVLSTIATALRIYCRGWVIKAFALDDWLAIVAQILFIVFCAFEITGVHYGTGQHIANIAPEAIPKAMESWWNCEPLYVLANMAIKASISLFLLRICVAKVQKIIIWTCLVVTEVYSTFFFLLFVLQCRPTSLFWLRYGPDPPAGSCLDPSIVPAAFYGYSAISCVVDWTFSILPIFLVWNLQMNFRMKVSVVLILAAGVIASSATIVRFPYLYSLTDVEDFLYSTSDVAIWSTVETGLAITAAGVATLRPLLRTFFGGGSSAPDYGNSARKWHRTGSAHQNEPGFDLQHRSQKGLGVTTVIDHSRIPNEVDLEGNKNDARSVASDPFQQEEDWNSSDSNLATRGKAPEHSDTPWNIHVKKSIVQTRT